MNPVPDVAIFFAKRYCIMAVATTPNIKIILCSKHNPPLFQSVFHIHTRPLSKWLYLDWAHYGIVNIPINNTIS